MLKEICYQGENIIVSDDGTTVIWNNSLRTITKNHDGYLVCPIKTNKGWREIAVHRLVATAFVPNPNNFPEVNHLDYNRSNANYTNLQWVSHAENVKYSSKHYAKYGSDNPNFGNHILSERYKMDKKLSIEKQSRRGVQNGRATKIELYYDGNLIEIFDYILLCCKYFIDNNISNSNNIETVRNGINRSIRKNIQYKKHYTFKKIK